MPTALGGMPSPGHSLGPVRLQQCGVVDDGGEQGREGPQQECRKELADDWVLENEVHTRASGRAVSHGGFEGITAGMATQ